MTHTKQQGRMISREEILSKFIVRRKGGIRVKWKYCWYNDGDKAYYRTISGVETIPRKIIYNAQKYYDQIQELI